MREGDPKAEEELFSRVYHELRALATSMLAREAPGHTLQPTALVDEAWLRLFGGAKLHCPDRDYFFAALAMAMRRILVENARRKKRLKRGGNLERVDIESVEVAAPLPDDELLAVDEALQILEAEDRTCAELVKLRFYTGLSLGDAAAALDIPRRTADRHWAYARAWLCKKLRE
jgi:RNA polymerase sigma factor (TIGR02999 family)